MLVILLPEQVVNHWEEIRYFIEAALPVQMQRGYDMNRVLEHIVGGSLLVALLTDKDGIIVAVFTLRVQEDRMLGVKNLVIVTGYASRMLVESEVDDMLLPAKKLAERQQCKSILFYTDKEGAIQLFKQSGGTEHKFIMWEV
jgi:hypothetical protein